MSYNIDMGGSAGMSFFLFLIYPCPNRGYICTPMSLVLCITNIITHVHISIHINTNRIINIIIIVIMTSTPPTQAAQKFEGSLPPGAASEQPNYLFLHAGSQATIYILLPEHNK